jgi:hypothetical protein
MHDQHLAQGALVAVMEREARHHLREGHPGAVAARLQAHEPVPDPRQRREQDAVWDLNVADPERVCERGPHRLRA